jgi:CSLREA domain-containing protein
MRKGRILAWLLLSLATAALAAPALARAATFTVNAADDTNDGACTPSHCSLREALNAANAAPGQDVVAFAIGGGGLRTIAPLTPFPESTGPVILDATTQPGYSGSPLIEIDGTLAAGDGLVVRGGDSTIRGFVVNRFPAPFRAIVVSGGSGNRVEANYVGTDASGTAAVPNDVGMEDHASGTVIGGAAPGARNLISGNGIGLGLYGAGALVYGNLVGTNASGTTPVSNGIGLQVNSSDSPASGNVIGGPASGERNVISANNVGIDLRFATATRIQGNLIGTDAGGSLPLGNTGDGIRVSQSSDSAIGGVTAAEGNVIANSFPSYGVEVLSGVHNAILGNSMHGNAEGIRLGIVGSVNDPGDADTGPNEGQNFPELGPVTRGGGSTTIDGVLNSHASTTYRIEFFACDGAWLGDGDKLLGVRDVTTDASGTAAFSFTFGEEAALVTSTATDPDGNTSEFGGCQASQVAQPAAAVTLSPRAALNEVGSVHTVTADVATVGVSPHALAGVTVRFAVQGSVTAMSSCTTGVNGECTFSYMGPATPGSDLISAYPDTNGNGIQDAVEVGDAVTKVWIAPAVTAGQVTGGGQTSNFGGDDLIAFGFNAQSDGVNSKGTCTVEDRASGTSIKCLNVTSLAVTGTHAVIRGNGTINGVPTTYRIEVDDLREPGAGSDRFTIETGSGYAAGGVLQKGNIQIHR